MRTSDLLSGIGATDLVFATPAKSTARLPGAGIASFWVLRGRPVFEAGGVLWGYRRRSQYVSLPHQLQLYPEPGEIEALMRRERIGCVRFPCAGAPGLSSGMYVCRPQNYGIHSVDRRQRGHVRRGLEICEIRAVDPDELLRAGICLNRETMQRQERFDPEFGDEAGWKRFVNAVRQCPEIEVTGAYVDGSLSAYVLACREDGWLHLLLQMSRTQELVHGISHALVFATLQQAGRDPSIVAVGNYYAGHLTTPGLGQFKTQMGFSVVTHNMSQRLHPGLAPLLANRAAIAALRVAQKAPPIRAKVESLTRIIQSDMISRNKDSGSGLPADQPCQHEEALGYSRAWRPHWRFLLWWYSKKVRKMGIRAALSKVPGFIRARTRRRPECSTPAVPKPLAAEEMLGLQPGDWVIVKSEEDIAATLDKRDKNRGLLFTREMHRYYGQRFRVFKRVEKIFMEESKQNRKVKNTVLLEGVHCQGLDLGCDKSCFLFWKEAWLRRAEQGPERLQFSPDDRT